MATQVAPQNAEKGLILACQRGDTQAMNTLFHRHRQSLFHLARRIMGNVEDAEDALQDGLLSAFRNVKRFEGRSQFSTWLTRIVVNAALMRRRSLVARPTVAAIERFDENEIPLTERLVSKSADPEQLLGRLEFQTAIKDHVNELSPILRTVFILRIVHECTTNEAAEILNVSANTVKARLWRARRQLAKRVSRSLFRGVGSPQMGSARFAAAPTFGD